ncbi:NAD(P)-binding protein [Aspergillus sclerotiicarbonarius CBS 121057]|uniref:NAD(P)-binding protein n=1 Tax=Aspergillus sclerotiicarbonarius (strain CBS 121057 / IBT 28362) TaxID=1448318 RepID=A0A319EW02_ASPSB|nr:NAD(P)-binding protein [Aspergillus sclerotiicarbonarius CBS 121057]
MHNPQLAHHGGNRTHLGLRWMLLAIDRETVGGLQISRYVRQPVGRHRARISEIPPRPTLYHHHRNDEAATTLTSEISTLTPGNNSILHIIHLDISTAIPPSKIQHVITTTITHIDVLIANAGFTTTPMTSTLTTTAEALRSAFEVNTIAPLLVFQAFWPLLQKARTAPKLIMITSSVGSITGQEPIPGGAYGPSRAAGNWLTRSIHIQHESEGLVAVALHPGWVRTRAEEFVAKEWKYAPGAPESVENSVGRVWGGFDGATRESVGGKFVTYTGQELPW